MKAQNFHEEIPDVSSHPRGQLERGIQPLWGSLCGWTGVKSRYLRAGVLRMGIEAPMRPGVQDAPEQSRKLRRRTVPP